jgi:hypothetical protein
MSANEMSLDEFLGHETRSSNKTGFLKGWKKKNPPHVDTWFNVNSPLTSLWQHQWPRIMEIERDGVKTREVWSRNFNSWETEALLKEQYKRTRDGSALRESPPLVCSMSIMIEEVRRLVREGELDWTDKLFKFVGDDPSKAVILHAGGIYNAYKKKDMTEDEKESLRKARISPKEAWKENLMAKCNYVFRVVVNDDLDSGNQIAIETTSLGEKVKKVIGDTMVGKGSEGGNPLLNPYCIRWTYDKDAKQFNEKYNAIKMDQIKLTSSVEDLINEPAPDITNIIKPGNIKELRTSMEAHYVGPEGALDWDYIFEKAERIQAEKDDKPFYEDDDAQVPDVRTKKDKPKKATKARKKKPEPEPDPEPEEEEEGYECDDCGNPMDEDEVKCSKCGAEYEVDEEPEEEEEPPPPPPKKTRSSKSKGKSSKGKAFKPKF